MTVELIYWDSDCFLGWFQEEPGKVEACSGTLKRAQDGEVVIVSSALTIAEVLWLRGGPRLPEEKSALIRGFFRRPYIRIRNVTRHLAEAAQDIVWKQSIKPKDAIHVATALDANALTLETFDEGLIGKSGSVGSPLALTIRRPIPTAQTELFPR
ncbi:MAG: type II toxin-antitoxin system VapC family toxin [Hyphomonadaceae bacterium]